MLLISSLSAAWLIVEFLLSRILSIDIFKDVGVYGLLAIIFICAFISLLIANLLHTNKQQTKESNKTDTETELISAITKAYNSENWNEVVKIGSVLSRPLWVTGKYELRIKVGKMVAKSASSSSHPFEQAQALIDDIGWTNHEIGNIKEAIKNIEHGVKIASEFGFYGLKYKGNRHLSGIFLESDIVKAREYLGLNKSKDIINKFDNSLEKNIAIAGNLVNEAMILDKEQDFQRALDLYKEAFKIYENNKDNDRKVKLYYFIGNNLKSQTRFSEAEDSFRKGLEEAKREARKDCTLKCLIGIASLKEIESLKSEAIKTYKKALEIATEMGNKEKIEYINNKINNLK